MRTFQDMSAGQYVILCARTLIALVLLIAGILKLGKPNEFVEAVRNYELLPKSIAAFAGRLLPVIELLAGIGLLSGILVLWSALTAVGLFVLFGLAVAINLLRGRRDISCGCFGRRQDERLSWGLVARNALLAGLAAAILPTANEGQQLAFLDMVIILLVAGAAFASWWLWGMILKMWPLPEDERF